MRVRVTGIVQGVGFRPFVYRLAVERHLRGWVANDAHGVTIVAEGAWPAVASFLDALRSFAPPLARVDAIEVAELGEPADGAARTTEAAFEIRMSEHRSADITALVPADVRTCDSCLTELRDPANRRYRHPFINCTDCGPRFTVVRAVPYDRANTTMAGFPMCERCLREYRDPKDRRFHAEPICCKDCGPRLRFVDRSGDDADDEAFGDDAAIAAAAEALRSGRIVAVKGLGGYLLAVRADDDAAVALLRTRKHRDEKPFAIQVSTLGDARNLVEIDEVEARALSGPEAPIVLANRNDVGVREVASIVAPRNARLGVMLPATALQLLLGEAVGVPLVMTSGNRSDEPVAYLDDDAFERLGGIADAFLLHDRPIHTRADDSVLRCIDGAPMLLRRARGYVPRAIRIPVSTGSPPVLAVGAELKSTVCLSRGDLAFVSTHLGDLEHASTFAAFRSSISALEAFLAVEPQLIVHDLHPEYLSTKWAKEQDSPLLAVQHHHAHLAACLAEHGFTGPAVGVVFDGHGYGPDGVLWGGEILYGDATGFERIGHLAEVALPGGTKAIREPWRMAVAHLERAYDGDVPRGLSLRSRRGESWCDVRAVAAYSKTPRTTSMGRLFDAAASILDVRDTCSYEGQAAIELEQLARRSPRNTSGSRSLLPIDVRADHSVMDPTPMLRSLCAEKISGTKGTDELAYAFHVEVADAAARVAAASCESLAVSTVVLSGGVFQNELLTSLVTSLLQDRRLCVLTHRLVPPNDGGLSLGQNVIGQAALRGER